MEQCVTASSHPTLTGAKLLCLMLPRVGRTSLLLLQHESTHTLALLCTRGHCTHCKGQSTPGQQGQGHSCPGAQPGSHHWAAAPGTQWQQLHLGSTRPAVHCLWQEVCTQSCRQGWASSGGMRLVGPPQQGTEMGAGRTGRCLCRNRSSRKEQLTGLTPRQGAVPSPVQRARPLRHKCLVSP